MREEKEEVVNQFFSLQMKLYARVTDAVMWEIRNAETQWKQQMAENVDVLWVSWLCWGSFDDLRVSLTDQYARS